MSCIVFLLTFVEWVHVWYFKGTHMLQCDTICNESDATVVDGIWDIFSLTTTRFGERSSSSFTRTIRVKNCEWYLTSATKSSYI